MLRASATYPFAGLPGIALPIYSSVKSAAYSRLHWVHGVRSLEPWVCMTVAASYQSYVSARIEQSSVQEWLRCEFDSQAEPPFASSYSRHRITPTRQRTGGCRK